MRSLRKLSVLAGLACLGAGSVAEAGIWKNLVVALDQTGFQFNGGRNPLSGGADLVISRTFNNQTFDFGATELTLSGTPIFTVSTGGRKLQTLDISLNTNNAPLTYSLTADSGNQLMTINGSLLMDATAKVNSLGYYDLQLNVSSRQTITNEGRVDQDPIEQDFDLGPINLRGNVFADLLASATDPIFQALGIPNIFAQFSASGQLGTSLLDAVAKAQAKLDAGASLSQDEFAYITSASAAAGALGLDVPDLSFLSDASFDGALSGKTAPLNVVPEPAGLLLLGLGSVALLRKRR
jgi:hypothetical protein